MWFVASLLSLPSASLFHHPLLSNTVFPPPKYSNPLFSRPKSAKLTRFVFALSPTSFSSRLSLSGPLIDFCLGPHIPHTGKIKAFSVTKASSSYFLGDASNESLQRIYGVSFPDSKQMTEYKKWIEEAEKRNHRKIGKVRSSPLRLCLALEVVGLRSSKLISFPFCVSFFRRSKNSSCSTSSVPELPSSFPTE